MSYSITELAKLTGISTRTLRFYDKTGLLIARRNPKNNYRYYDKAEVDQLQKIMFLRLFNLPLAQIKKIMQSSTAIQYQALKQQRQKIIAEKNRLTALIDNLDQTLTSMKGKTPMNMSDQEKFIAFKTQKINDNEKMYGKEIHTKYGNDLIDTSKQKVYALSKKEFDHLEQITKQILVQLKPLVGTTDFQQPAAKQLFTLHKEYLLMMWPSQLYSSTTHKNLATMYVCDERFKKYYEEGTGKKGATQTLKDIIDYYA
jgi:DNA-binding transcriptional MerR regulator